MSNKNFLVTGGAGFIGSACVGELVKNGDNVIVLDAMTYAGHKENLDWITGPGSYKLVVGNICDTTLVLKLLTENEIDVAINFAAESHVDNSIHSPSVFIDTNIIGTYKMLEASLAYYKQLGSEKKQAFRYVQVSTDEVYGSLGETGKFSETTAMQPNSPYSASKAAGDHLTRAWHETYELPTILTNCSNNYGPRQYPEKLIPHIITRALSGNALPIYGDGKNIRDWIHVEDHIRGVILAATSGVLGNSYCFGGNSEMTNIDLVGKMCSILDEMKPKSDGQSYSSQIKFVADRAGHDRRYAIDSSKAERELGFKRNYDLDRGLKLTIQWYLENSNWCDAVTKKAA